MKNTMLLFSATMHYNATMSNRYIAEIYLALYVKKVNTYFFRNILKNQAFHDTDIYLLQNTFSVKSMPIALIGRLSTNFSSTFFHYCCYHHQHLLSSVFLWHILLSTCFSPLLLSLKTDFLRSWQSYNFEADQIHLKLWFVFLNSQITICFIPKLLKNMYTSASDQVIWQ